jgi:outer membrane protein assembly factor BamB
VGVIAVIELGEVPTGRVVEDDRPARPRLRRRWPSAALVLAVSLSTAVAGDTVPGPLPSAVVDVPGDVRILIAGNRLFVVQPFALSQGRSDGRYVAAFHLMDLEQLWRVDLPPGGDVYTLTTVDGTLALTGEPPPPAPGGKMSGASGRSVTQTVGLDMGTGALLWRHEGFVEAETVGGRLILSTEFGRPGSVPAGVAPGGAGMALRAVSGGGDVVWSYTPPSGALRSYHYSGDAVRRLVVILPDGRVELRDTDSGKLLTSRRIGPLRWDEPAGPPYVEVVGDLLLVRMGSHVQAYGLDQLDLRWQLPFEAGRGGWFTACGDAICVIHGEGGLRVLDRGTGQARWSDPRWTWGFASGRWLMVTDSDPRHELQTLAVVDPSSGQVRRDLGRWNAFDVADGSIVALRFDGTRVLVAQLDPADGARMIGAVQDVIAPSCHVRLPSLWCRRSDNTLGVWRLPSDPSASGGPRG